MLLAWACWTLEEGGQPALLTDLCFSVWEDYLWNEENFIRTKNLAGPFHRAHEKPRCCPLLYNDHMRHVSETTVYLKCTCLFLLVKSLPFLSLTLGAWPSHHLSGQDDWRPPGPCRCSQALRCFSKRRHVCALLPESSHSHAWPKSLSGFPSGWGEFFHAYETLFTESWLLTPHSCCPAGVRVSEPETWEIQLPVGFRCLGPGEACGA